MTEREIVRERLIEIIKKSVDGCAEYWAGLIADGILESKLNLLPCTVGDTVYVLNREGEPQEMKFDSVDLRCTCTRENYCGLGTRCRDKESNICQYRFKNDFSDFGKTVFLTREEAEKALADAKLMKS